MLNFKHKIKQAFKMYKFKHLNLTYFMRFIMKY